MYMYVLIVKCFVIFSIVVYTAAYNVTLNAPCTRIYLISQLQLRFDSG